MMEIGHRLLWVIASAGRHAKLDCKYLGKFFNPKWPDSRNQALEKAMSVLPFLFRDALKNLFVRLIQSDGQFIRGFPNT
jgi:hypothetical protein